MLKSTAVQARPSELLTGWPVPTKPPWTSCSLPGPIYSQTEIDKDGKLHDSVFMTVFQKVVKELSKSIFQKAAIKKEIECRAILELNPERKFQ